MSLANAWKPFLYAFYFLGQSPFPSSATSKNYFKQLLFKLPPLILISASLYAIIHFTRGDFHISWDKRGLDVIHFLLILSSLITNVVLVYRCLFRGSVCIRLQESFSALEIDFQNLLPSKNVHLTKFRNVFLLKCFAMFILYIALIFAMAMARIRNEHSYTSFMILLIFNIDLCVLQVVLYVDLIKFFLMAIADTFNIETAMYDRQSYIKSELLASGKKLYSSVYKVVDKVNEHFGLLLLTYIVHQFLVISYYIFWILSNKFSVGFWTSLDNVFVLLCAVSSFFFVSDSCHKMRTEAKNIVNFLCEGDWLGREETQHFLTQMVNQPIKITTMEFYQLDRSFFAALTVGGITTAIMLVQFQNNLEQWTQL